MTSFPDLLSLAKSTLDGDVDPDGAVAQQALLLAVHAGTAQPGAGNPDWDRYAVAALEAAAHLRDGLADPAVVMLDDRGVGPATADARVVEIVGPGPDRPDLRESVAALVCRLADMYAAAAVTEAGSPWRRLVWAHVAHLLDDAVWELR